MTMAQYFFSFLSVRSKIQAGLACRCTSHALFTIAMRNGVCSIDLGGFAIDIKQEVVHIKLKLQSILVRKN